MFNNRSTYSFQTYRAFFMKAWHECVNQGWATNDARQFAQMEWDKWTQEQNKQ